MLDLRDEGTLAPEPADGRYWYFDGMIWDRSGEAGDNIGIQEEEEDDDDGDYDQDRGNRGSGKKSSFYAVEPDNVGERDVASESHEEAEMDGVSRMPEK